MIKQQHLHQFGIMVILLFSIISHSAMALSLGEIKVHSHFAEPFLAEIELPSYSADEMGSIEIHLASAKQHEAMGYEFSQISKQFRFVIKEDDEGTLYIEVRTKSPIKKLSISLLIEVTTINGRIIKGYDILLSPKSVSSAEENNETDSKQVSVTEKSITQDEAAEKRVEVAEVQIAEVQAEVQTTETEEISSDSIDSVTFTPQQNKEESKVKKLEGGGFEYRNVEAGESLSRIAQRIRPHESMHMYQVMLALYNENPDSFLDENINNLKVGSTLKLEDIDAITDVSKSRAYDLIQKYAAISTTVQNNESDDASRLHASNNKEFLSARISDENNNGQIAAIKLQLENAKKMVKELGLENKNLLDRIATLEAQINQTTKEIFSPLPQAKMQTQPNSLTEKSQFINENVEKTEKEDDSIFATLKQNQTSLSFAGIGALSIALIAARKKDEVLNLIHSLKLFRKREKNIFS